MEAITIERRYRGPTASGNGGWSAGVLAARLSAAGHDGPIEVTLRRPPPLDTTLSVTVDDARAANLVGPGGAVAEAITAERSALGDPVDPVDVAAARAAEGDYAGLRFHPFPECFVCGPERADGDGMRLFPGPIGPGRTAATWTPHETMTGPDGRLDPTYVWAALDCPSGWAAYLEGRSAVLGRMTAYVAARPRAGETHVAVGRLRDIEERKIRTASTVYDSDGRVVGQAAHVWIAVDPTAFS